MPTAQPGIFAEDSIHHYFLEYAIAADTDSTVLNAAIAEALRAAAGAPAAQLVFAAGDRLRQCFDTADIPDTLRPFATIEGWEAHRAPATQRELLFWIHGASPGPVFDCARRVHQVLASTAHLELDLPAFVYHDSRDLTGFIDGTANPTGADARAAALIPAGAPGTTGSFVLTQRWVHDLDAFHALPTAEQERVIGRTKADSVELSAEEMPAGAHVNRTDITVDGVPQEIYRRSVPYGTVQEHGLYFLAFACDLSRFRVLLEGMFGVSGDGEHDRLIEYSTPVTGSFWYAPPVETLEAAFGVRPA